MPNLPNAPKEFSYVYFKEAASCELRAASIVKVNEVISKTIIVAIEGYMEQIIKLEYPLYF
jgi:hypothetical protein